MKARRRFGAAACTALLGVFTAGLVVGCKKDREEDKTQERQDNATKVTPESTDDATESIVDEDYRFRLGWPGEGWKLLREGDASRLNAGATAALQHLELGVMFLTIEEAPGASLDKMLDFITANLPAEDVVVKGRNDVTIGEIPARRADIEAKIADVPRTMAIVAFLHQDYLYQLQFTTLGDSDVDALVRAGLDNFEILEGEVKGRADAHAEPKDLAGVGWSLRDGKYRNAFSGVTIEPPEGWRVVVGNELKLMNAEAEVGMVHTRPEAYLVVLSERMPSTGGDAFAEHIVEQFAQGMGSEPELVALEVAGTKQTMRRYVSDSLQFHHGVRVQGETLSQVLTWCFEGLAERAAEPTRAALSAIQYLDDEARLELRKELATQPHPQVAVGDGWAVRGGTFYDFTRGVKWKAPDALWGLAGGQDARGVHEEAILSIEARGAGVMGILVAGDATGQDAAAWHRTILERWGRPAKSRPDTKLAAGGSAQRSLATGDIGGAPYEWAYATTVQGNLGFALIAWAPGPMSKDATAAVEAAVAGWSLDPSLLEISDVDGFVDHRLGYRFRPPKGMGRTDQTPAELTSMARVSMWKSGNDVVSVQAMLAPGQDSGDFMEGFLEQTLREQLSKSLSSGAPARAQTTVDGHPANKLTWTDIDGRVDAVVFSDGPRVFALSVANATDDEFEGIARSFEVLH